jgi:hypothetical protein
MTAGAESLPTLIGQCVATGMVWVSCRRLTAAASNTRKALATPTVTWGIPGLSRLTGTHVRR